MPSAPAAPSAGYHPRPAQNQLKEIVEENIEELLQVGDERFPLGMRRGSSCGIAGATGQNSSARPGTTTRKSAALAEKPWRSSPPSPQGRKTSSSVSSGTSNSGLHRGNASGMSAAHLPPLGPGRLPFPRRRRRSITPILWSTMHSALYAINPVPPD